jgi:hypothetical protein
VFGWFGRARAEFPATFFMLEHYYSTQETVTYRSTTNDVCGDWLVATPSRIMSIRRSVPQCHGLDRQQDAFARVAVYADDPAHADRRRPSTAASSPCCR